jgi:hypothetical protein
MDQAAGHSVCVGHNPEFKGLASFKVHDLETLLHLTGRATRIRASYMTEWSVVVQWNPDVRYRPVGSADRTTVTVMIKSVETLLTAI